MKANDRCIGFIGLGIMGKPMASRLLEAGYDLAVFNRSRAVVDELADRGACPAASVADLASRSDVVITMLPNSPDVEQVVLGDDGVIACARPRTLLIDMSTIAADSARRIVHMAEERGMEALDAPVSGGERGAIEGTLSVMCGGSAAAVERARPIFAHLAGRVVHVGEAGSGQVVKACNQIMVGVTLQAMAEALVLAAKSGVDPDAAVEALLGGAARCWALEVRASTALQNDFKPGFRVALHHKDLGLALEAGARTGVPLPTTALVREFFGSLMAMGRGDYDHSALMTLVGDLSSFSPNGKAQMQ